MLTEKCQQLSVTCGQSLVLKLFKLAANATVSGNMNLSSVDRVLMVVCSDARRGPHTSVSCYVLTEARDDAVIVTGPRSRLPACLPSLKTKK